MDSRDAVKRKRSTSPPSEQITDTEPSIDLSLLEALEKSHQNSILTLDLKTLNKLALSLERRLKANTAARLKYPDDPEKFADSELELHDELQKLKILAGAPELYKDLVRIGTLESITGLLNHDNTDIAIDAVTLLQDLTDADVVEDNDESAQALVDALIENNAVELLVQNLARLNDSDPDESAAIYNTLSTIENLIEVKPSVSELVCEKTKLLKWLQARIKVREFDSNKQYASEILAILLQNNVANQKRFGQMNGVDTLLQAVAMYKSKDPKTGDEEEMVENLFDSLCCLLMPLENKERFVKAEGVELMIIIMNQKKLCYGSAIRALDFAMTNYPPACERFVDVMGLKTAFPAFMGKIPLSKKNKRKRYKEELEERLVSVVASLFGGILRGSRRERLFSKFVENEYEKIDRLMELYLRYSDRVKAEIDRLDELELDDLDVDEEEKYNRKLDSGLYTLQLIAVILGHLWTSGKKVKGAPASAVLNLPENANCEAQLEKKKSVEETPLKKEVFVIKHRRSHERQSSGEVKLEEPTAVLGTPLPCSKDEVDAILIQCGRLSRSSSAVKVAGETPAKCSGTKRSYDFDQEPAKSDENNVAEDEERENRRRDRSRPAGPRRRTPSREREKDRSGRRVSRSPGRRSESPVPNNTSSGSASQSSRPGKMVSVPATVSSLSHDANSVKRIQVKRNVGASPPRNRSPARLRTGTDNQPPPSLSRSNSKKADNSPFRRNPLAEIDTNVVVAQGPPPSKKPSNPTTKQITTLPDEKKVVTNVISPQQGITRSRSSRLSRDLDMDQESKISSSYTALLLEDIQNFHQKTSADFALPACLTKACSILEAVADLNSSTAGSTALVEDRRRKAETMMKHEMEEPVMESMIVADVDLMEPSFHKCLTDELGEQESSGSNSVQPQWVSSSNSAAQLSTSSSSSAAAASSRKCERSGNSSSKKRVVGRTRNGTRTTTLGRTNSYTAAAST